MAGARDYRAEPRASSAFGCFLVLMPFLAFVVVMPDAAHVWREPFSNPLVWLAGSVGAWFVLTALLGRVAEMRCAIRMAVYAGLVMASTLVAFKIVTSI